MKLSTLAGTRCEPDPEITSITADSRAVSPGALFAALAGVNSDGADYIHSAEKAGAAAILTRAGIGAQVPVINDREPRRRLAQMAAKFHPGCPPFMAAITGTNGKTSTARFASQLWCMLGVGGGSLGTLGVEASSGTSSGESASMEIKLAHTTPDPVVLHQALSKAARIGCTHMAMEVSSHGLAQYRADGLRFDVAGFTNITRDHLDYHGDFADYFKAKQRLFLELLKPGGVAIINSDGAGSEALQDALKARNIGMLMTGRGGQYLDLKMIAPKPSGLDITVKGGGRIFDLSLSLIGAFQVENVLLAAAIVMASGYSAGEVLPLTGRLAGVPGRMMLAGMHRGAGIYVDYAHTPDAIATALAAARAHTRGRLIAIIGAGGDRDREKRPLMGSAAALGADHVIVTDDNPRSEDPAAIRHQVMGGVPDGQNIGDRAAAIAAGVAMVESGDVLMILGKGHETGQVIGDRVLPFDDGREVAKLVGV